MRGRVAHRVVAVAEALGQRPDVHLAQVEAVADGDRVAVGDQVVVDMLAHHPDYVVAVDRDVRVRDLGIDDVVDARGL